MLLFLLMTEKSCQKSYFMNKEKRKKMSHIFHWYEKLYKRREKLLIQPDDKAKILWEFIYANELKVIKSSHFTNVLCLKNDDVSR